MWFQVEGSKGEVDHTNTSHVVWQFLYTHTQALPSDQNKSCQTSCLQKKRLKSWLSKRWCSGLTIFSVLIQPSTTFMLHFRVDAISQFFFSCTWTRFFESLPFLRFPSAMSFNKENSIYESFPLREIQMFGEEKISFIRARNSITQGVNFHRPSYF